MSTYEESDLQDQQKSTTWKMLTEGFQSIRKKITKSGAKICAKDYASSVKSLFEETYFIENWI